MVEMEESDGNKEKRVAFDEKENNMRLCLSLSSTGGLTGKLKENYWIWRDEDDGVVEQLAVAAGGGRDLP